MLHEVNRDLDSVHAAMAAGYYRSGLQSLRSALEILIACAVLTLSENTPNPRDRWGGLSWPRFNGRKASLLTALATAGTIDTNEQRKLIQIYRQLSQFVHGHSAYWREEEIFDDFISEIYDPVTQRLRASDNLVQFGEAVFPVVERCLVR